MTDKFFFDECVHLSPQEVPLFFLGGQQKLPIWKHSKFTEDAN